MKKLVILAAALGVIFFGFYFYKKTVSNKDLDINKESSSKKILFIDSYHKGYEWSDGLAEGLIKTLGPTGIQFDSYYMDTKNNPGEDFKLQAGLLAKTKIEEYRPDVVIACDDNAFKYVVQKYYLNSTLPFVFCGINWTASSYKIPADHITGMLEVSLYDQAIDSIKDSLKGNRVGFLSGKNESEQKNADAIKNHLNLNLTKTYLVSTFDEWKEGFKKLQKEVDIVIVGVPTGITFFDEKAAELFIQENITIPSIVEHEWLIPYALVAYGKSAEEQTMWASETAIRILKGENTKDIPIVKNKKGFIAINLKVAKKLNIDLGSSLLQNAEVIYK
jgi:ABC-type uncharacterized transport system substrate-binding protein